MLTVAGHNNNNKLKISSVPIIEISLSAVYTPIRGFSTIFKKSALDVVYPADFWDTLEIREI